MDSDFPVFRALTDVHREKLRDPFGIAEIFILFSESVSEQILFLQAADLSLI